MGMSILSLIEIAYYICFQIGKVFRGRENPNIKESVSSVNVDDSLNAIK